MKDDLQVVSTDHCPFDFHGQKDLGKGDFRKVPNGLPGVEDRSTCSTTAGSSAGGSPGSAGSRSSRRRPRSCSGCIRGRAPSRPARTRTSSIYDPKRDHTISAKTHHMDVDYSCYEGREVQGGSDIVLSAAARSSSGTASSPEEGRRQVHQARDRRLRPDGVTTMDASGTRSLRVEAHLGGWPRFALHPPGRRGRGSVRAAEDLVQAVDEAT